MNNMNNELSLLGVFLLKTDVALASKNVSEYNQIRKYHNDTLQTDSHHCEEEPQNNKSQDIKIIAKLERTQSIA